MCWASRFYSSHTLKNLRGSEGKASGLGRTHVYSVNFGYTLPPAKEKAGSEIQLTLFAKPCILAMPEMGAPFANSYTGIVCL